jgi:uncharacterized membrane protein
MNPFITQKNKIKHLKNTAQTIEYEIDYLKETNVQINEMVEANKSKLQLHKKIHALSTDWMPVDKILTTNPGLSETELKYGKNLIITIQNIPETFIPFISTEFIYKYRHHDPELFDYRGYNVRKSIIIEIQDIPDNSFIKNIKIHGGFALQLVDWGSGFEPPNPIAKHNDNIDVKLLIFVKNPNDYI